MKNSHSTGKWFLILGLTACLSGVSLADPLAFARAPVTDAAQQIGAKYGVRILWKGNPHWHVTFTLDNTDSPETRLQAINTLANALDADFTKVYVIHKSAGGEQDAVQADSTGLLPFQQRTFSAREAITQVAAADHALVQFESVVDGTLTVTSSTTAAAAGELARQTQTQWTATYILTPHSQGLSPGGRFADPVNGGATADKPLLVYYRTSVQEMQSKREAQAQQQMLEQQQQAEALQAQRQALAQQAVQQTNAAAPNGSVNNSDGFNPYGYNLYGAYNPLGNSGQYGMSSGGFNGNYFGGNPYNVSPYGGFYSPSSGLIIQGGSGFGNIVFGSNGYEAGAYNSGTGYGTGF